MRAHTDVQCLSHLRIGMQLVVVYSHTALWGWGGSRAANRSEGGEKRGSHRRGTLQPHGIGHKHLHAQRQARVSVAGTW